MTHETRHPAGCSLPTADTARLCPCPHPLKGNSKNFPGTNQHAEKEEQRLLLLCLFWAKSNCLMVASGATRPRRTCRQRGQRGGFEPWGGRSAGAAGSPPTTLPGPATGTRGTAPARGHTQPQNLGTLKCSGGDGTALVQHPCGHWYHSGDNSHGDWLAGWIIPRYNDAILCPKRRPGPSHAPAVARFALNVPASPGRGYQCKTHI